MIKTPVKVEITEVKEPNLLVRFRRGVRDEWDQLHPQGPPETYTNGEPMDPKDAMIYGGLITLSWILYIAIAAAIVILAIEMATGP